MCFVIKCYIIKAKFLFVFGVMVTYLTPNQRMWVRFLQDVLKSGTFSGQAKDKNILNKKSKIKSLLNWGILSFKVPALPG